MHAIQPAGGVAVDHDVAFPVADDDAAGRDLIALAVHRGPGFQAEGLCYRPDGSVIKAVNPDNCWILLIDANGVANVELDDAGRFTVYVEAASNPLVES